MRWLLYFIGTLVAYELALLEESRNLDYIWHFYEKVFRNFGIFQKFSNRNYKFSQQQQNVPAVKDVVKCVKFTKVWKAKNHEK